MTDVIDATPAQAGRMAWYELNDIGNAARLRDLAQGRLLWVVDHWMAYDGTRWTADDGERLARKLAQDVARHIPIEAEALEAELAAMDRGKRADCEENWTERMLALHKHATATGNSNRIAGMLVQAQSEIYAVREDFDRDPLAINFQNCTVRIGRHGDGWALRECRHDPADRISRIAAVNWAPDAPRDRWLAHMGAVLPSVPVRKFFQNCAGYGLSGEITEQCIFLLQGKGGDGKSTTMDVIRQVMGGYGSAADVQTFIAGAMRNGNEATPDLARLAGDTRLVSTGEPRIGASLDEARIKQVTGGQPVTARELNKAPFEYLPRFKVYFECNRKPRISGDDDGIWRRIIVIQFPNQFKDKADKRFKAKLLEQGEGVMAWLVEGLLAWLHAGTLELPEEVKEAVDDYRKAANPFGEWFATWVDTSKADERAEAKALYDSYKRWCEENSVGDREVMTSTAFGRALSDKQLMKAKAANGRVYRKGARLRDERELTAYVPATAMVGPADAASPGWEAEQGW